MVAFREMFDGQLWMEVMLVKNVNDTEKALLAIAAALGRIYPDQVHLNVPIRPPAETWVEFPDDESLVRAIAILGEVASIVTPAEDSFKLAEDTPIADAVIEIIRRHPMQEAKVMEPLSHFAPDEIQATLTAMEASGQVRRLLHRGQVFWEYAGGAFGERKEQAKTCLK